MLVFPTGLLLDQFGGKCLNLLRRVLTVLGISLLIFSIRVCTIYLGLNSSSNEVP